MLTFHQDKGPISTLVALCEANPPVTGGFPPKMASHDDVIKLKYFQRYWPFVWIPRTKARDAEAWCFLWSAPWINRWVNNREAGDLWRHRAHYDVIVVMLTFDVSSVVGHNKLFNKFPLFLDAITPMCHFNSFPPSTHIGVSESGQHWFR